MTDAPVPAPTALIVLILVAVASGVLSWRIWLMYRPASAPVTLPNRQKTQSVDTQMPQAAAEPASSTPSVAPTPNKGQGNYVCDSLGFCNLADEKGKAGCPVTFADPKCLSSCGDVAKRCP